jgi:hypothetical protein
MRGTTMLLLLRIFLSPLVLFAILSFQGGGKMAAPKVSTQSENHNPGSHVSVVIRTDHGKYSLGDTVKLDVSLHNTGDREVYVDRRMFWGGIGSGLVLEIRDQQGKHVPLHLLYDHIMPPPKEGDTSILVRLDGGFFYGTEMDFLAKDGFPKPGRYSIRVTYKSWLPKEFVAAQLRGLPALWAEAPAITSEPIWIEVTR